MAEFTLNGRGYKTGKLDALTQLSIAVKVLPIIPAMKPVAEAYAKHRAAAVENARAIQAGETMEAIPEFDMAILARLGEALASLPDDSRNGIIAACLKVVFYQPEGSPGYLPAWSTRDSAPADGMNMVVMLRLVWAVFMDNLESFSKALASISTTEAGA